MEESSGDESDATVVLEYSDEGDTSTRVPSSDAEDVSNVPTREVMAESTTETTTATLSSPARYLASLAADESLSALPTASENDYDSDVSPAFGSDSEEAARPMAFPPEKKTIYASIAFYDSLSEAEQVLHGHNSFTYTYHTRCLSPFVLGKVYKCRSHIDCNHRLKLSIHRADAIVFRYQLLQQGQHSGPSVHLTERGISPVTKPEIDALLKLGMSAGRVRNMMLFKYMRDPGMLVHVPTVRAMENRKAYLKKQAAGGWEMNKFATLQNWTLHKMCQHRSNYFSVDETNMVDMNK
ncbi:hypothetical protein ON010_g3524 [Phytophthora cinnamomi]|nr:hypothetical protein ON010_g3524 [Phytophthora cinnamomi]